MRGFAFSVLLLGTVADAQTPVVLLTGAQDLPASVHQLEAIQRAGMQVQVVAGPGAFIGLLTDGPPSPALRQLGQVVGEEDARNGADPHGSVAAQRALRYLADRRAGRFDSEAVRAPMDWSGHPNDVIERPRPGSSGGDGGERDNMPEAPDWTCSEAYNSEYMVGTVCSSVFFVESNGTVDPDLYSWSPTDIASVEAQMIDAWSIWSYTAGLAGITVTAVMDFHEPAEGISVQPYEPVTHSSAQDYLWIQRIMQNAGRTEASAIDACDGYDHDKRTALGVDHAYCTFIACNPPSAGAPSQFTDGRIGYAYLGGPYVQLLLKANGWTTDQVNRVYGHETTHIFHAFDEYTASGSSNCSRTFNGRQNSNFQGSPCNGTAACLMINNSFTGSGATRRWNLCAHTPYHIGWLGRLQTPLCQSPVNDAVVATAPVTFHWDRMGAPSGVYGYLKIYDRNTGQLVRCVDIGSADSVQVPLVNGLYRWTVGLGNANVSFGYAGVSSAAANFTVQAPLQAIFSAVPVTACAGTRVSFTDESAGSPTSWTWTFPGGSPATWSGASPPGILYATPGNYDVTLTVGDGNTTATHTTPHMITVTGGAALPFVQDFNGGSFPPAGWTMQGGQGQGGQGISWTADVVGGCTYQTSALVDAYSFAGPYGITQLNTPRIDLSGAQLPYLRFRYAYAQRSSTPTETFSVSGHDCGYAIYQEFFDRNGASLATNGGAYVTGHAWQPAQCSDWREVLLPMDTLAHQVAQLTFQLFSQGGQDLFLDDVNVFDGMRVQVRALLQGPYQADLQLMSDTLRAQGLLPSTEPYTGLGVALTEGGGAHLGTLVPTTTGPNAVVDWVVLEVRDPALPTRVLYTRPALLQRDGDVVDYDGSSAVRIGLPAGSYHLCLKHRNHLGIMTAAPVPLATGMAPLDLSDPATATWGTDGRYIANGKAFLWCGDALGDGNVRYTGLNNDRDPLLLLVGSTTPNNAVPGYRREDVDLNGTVRYTGANNDRDPILFNLGGTTPNNVRVQQVP